MTARASFTERAALIRSARERDRLTIPELARRFNCSVSTVHKYLTLLELAPELQAAVDQEVFPLRQAIRLAHKRTHAEQREILRELVAADALVGPRLHNSITAAIARKTARLGHDTHRALGRDFLERWLKVLEAGGGADVLDGKTIALVRFVLGGPPPLEHLASLQLAGFRSKKERP